MNSRHRHTTRHPETTERRMRKFWQREETLLSTLAAFLAFALIYAYSGDADLYFPLVSALGMGTMIYTVIWLALRRKP